MSNNLSHRGETEWQRLLSKLCSNAVWEPNSGCLIWEGRVNDAGYAVFSTPLFATKLVHRMVFRLVKGWLPDWLTVDHLCFVPSCINPDHLVAASRSFNSKRKRR